MKKLSIEQSADVQAIANWLLKNVLTVSERQQAEAWAYTAVSSPAYDRTTPILNNRIGGFDFDMPAPQHLPAANEGPAVESPKYFYKDFATGKVKYTRAKFIGWTQPTGLLSVHYAIFSRRSDTLFIPVYSLTAETRKMLPEPPKKG